MGLPMSRWLPHLDRSGWTKEGLWLYTECDFFQRGFNRHCGCWYLEFNEQLIEDYFHCQEWINFRPHRQCPRKWFVFVIFGMNAKKWKCKNCRTKRKSTQKVFPAGQKYWIHLKGQFPKKTSHLFCTDHKGLWSNSPHLQSSSCVLMSPESFELCAC